MATCEGKVVITKHPDGCLMIFPRPVWDKFSAQIAALPLSEIWTKRIFLGNATPVDVDSTGRVLISPELRETANISKETTLRGMGSYFELWDKATYEAKELRQDKLIQENPPAALQNISI